MHRFVVVEGLIGVGKTSLCRLLRDAWERWSGAWGARMAHASILALDRAHVQRLEKVVHDFLEATPELARGGYLFWWHQDTGVWDPLPRIP